MLLTHLLAFLLSIFIIAHAAPTEISLHNDAVEHESTVVSNWTQICKHLCSLNLSGPGCELKIGKCIPVEDDDGEEIFNITLSKYQDELCETLCENGLGVNQCDCKVQIIPASSPKSLKKPDKHKICYDFCRFRRVTLKGCSKCSPQSLAEYERHCKLEDSHEEDLFFVPPPPPPPPLHLLPPLHHPIMSISSDMSLPFVPVPQVHRFVAQEQTTTPDTAIPTTPDWNRICAQLCKTGSGGLLCNCDLPPF